VAIIHRFGSTLNAHLHFHCVVIDDRRKSPGGTVCSTAPPRGGVIFNAATGLEANTIAQVQAQVRRRMLRAFARRGLPPGDDARAMGQWAHGGGFSVNGSVRIEAKHRAGRERRPVARHFGNCRPQGSAKSIPRPSRHRTTSSISASPGRQPRPPVVGVATWRGTR
jgi:hypothetical protein